MESVPDIDELLDQLEADEIASSTPAVSSADLSHSQQKVSSNLSVKKSQDDHNHLVSCNRLEEIENGIANSETDSDVVSDLIKLDEVSQGSYQNDFTPKKKDELINSNIDDLLGMDFSAPVTIVNNENSNIGESFLSSHSYEQESPLKVESNRQNSLVDRSYSEPPLETSPSPADQSSSSSEYFSVVGSMRDSPCEMEQSEKLNEHIADHAMPIAQVPYDSCDQHVVDPSPRKELSYAPSTPGPCTSEDGDRSYVPSESYDPSTGEMSLNKESSYKPSEYYDSSTTETVSTVKESNYLSSDYYDPSTEEKNEVTTEENEVATEVTDTESDTIVENIKDEILVIPEPAVIENEHETEEIDNDRRSNECNPVESREPSLSSPIANLDERVHEQSVDHDVQSQEQSPERNNMVTVPAEIGFDAARLNLDEEPYFEIQLEVLPDEDDGYATILLGQNDIEQSVQDSGQAGQVQNDDHERLTPPIPPREPPRSLIASAHDANEARELKLTESEMQLGKIKPYWIPDPDSPCCLICTRRFTLIRRRHHCRSCGRVLCRDCCKFKSKLPYLESREGRVCEPCSRTLNRIEVLETEKKETTAGEAPTDANDSDNVDVPCTSTDHLPVDNVDDQEQVTVSGVLKRAESSRVDGYEEGAVDTGSAPKSVTFSDGIRPGNGQEGGGSPMMKLKKKKPGGRMGQRVAVLRMTQELECFLPNRDPTEEAKHPLVFSDDARHQVQDNDWLVNKLKNDGLEFAIKRNLTAFVKIIQLDCCLKKEVWYICSRGLCFVASSEVVVVLERIPEENTVPLDALYLFNHLYDQALKGRRPRELDCSLYYINSVSGSTDILGSPDHAGFLYFRPTLQCLQNVPLPENPYLMALLVHRLEVPWAMVLPYRLLLRLGLEFGFYPCPVMSQRFRQPMFREVGQTMMNVFVDFRNYSYSLPIIYESTVSLQENNASICLSKSKHEQLLKIIGEKNQPHLLAWRTVFNSKADSHLICTQNEAGLYTTQAFNIEGRERKVTGASFIVFNGVLKTGTSEAQCSLIEDGFMVRMRPEAMENLADGNFTVDIKWLDTVEHEIAQLGTCFSAVDGRSLENLDRVCITLESLSSLCLSGTQYSLRLTELVLLNSDNGQPFQTWAEELWRFAKQLEPPLTTTLVPFVESLTKNHIRRLSLRLSVGPDTAEYDVGAWCPGLQQERSLWLSTLDEHLIQTLFQQGMKQPYTANFELVFSFVYLN